MQVYIENCMIMYCLSFKIQVFRNNFNYLETSYYEKHQNYSLELTFRNARKANISWEVESQLFYWNNFF